MAFACTGQVGRPCRRRRGGCGRKSGFARTLSLPARVTADSQPHPFHGSKRPSCLGQLERVDVTRAEESRQPLFTWRLALGLAYAPATPRSPDCTPDTLRSFVFFVVNGRGSGDRVAAVAEAAAGARGALSTSKGAGLRSPKIARRALRRSSINVSPDALDYSGVSCHSERSS